MRDIVDRLEDLHKQATLERSHYYTGKCIRDAINEIEHLRKLLALLDTKVPCDVKLPPATIISKGCTFRTLAAGILNRMDDDVPPHGLSF